MALVDLIMPKLGESIMEATVLKWCKKVGEPIAQDETVLEIATDKVDSEVPSTAAGVLAEILFNENDVVPIGTVIARIETSASGSVAPAVAVSTVQETKVESVVAETVPYIPHGTQPTNVPTAGSNKFYSPLVLNIALVF